MPKDAQLHFDETPTSLTISWDNRRVRKDWFVGCFFTLFLVVLTPATMFASLMVVFFPARMHKDTWDIAGFVELLAWTLFMWFALGAVYYTMIGRRWRETIVLAEQNVSLSCRGLWARRPRLIPFSSIEQFA